MKISPIKPYVKTAVKQRNVVENLNKVIYNISMITH